MRNEFYEDVTGQRDLRGITLKLRDILSCIWA